MDFKANIKIETEMKEYPELTIEQLEQLVSLIEQGKTEEEALAIVLK